MAEIRWRMWAISMHEISTVPKHAICDCGIATTAHSCLSQWFWLLLYALITVPFAPFIKSPVKYFRGGLGDTAQSTGSLLLLASSVSISWVFAKSIQNVSLLGAQYSLVGCLAYGELCRVLLLHGALWATPAAISMYLSCAMHAHAASYYTSFASVGVVVYLMRTRKGYRSLPEAINQRYGPLATLSFGNCLHFMCMQSCIDHRHSFDEAGTAQASQCCSGCTRRCGAMRWW